MIVVGIGGHHARHDGRHDERDERGVLPHEQVDGRAKRADAWGEPVVAYQPPSLDEAQAATIVPPESRAGHWVSIERIDGVAPNAGVAMGLAPYRSPIVVAPGRHTIRVKVNMGLRYGHADLWLAAEPGRTYRIEADTHRLGFSVRLVDDTTGRPVGGQVGDDSSP